MPASPRLIAVTGATGNQGGSVAKLLLKYPEKYKVRAVTRDVNSKAAKQLAEMGAEVFSVVGLLGLGFAGTRVLIVLFAFSVGVGMSANRPARAAAIHDLVAGKWFARSVKEEVAEIGRLLEAGQRGRPFDEAHP